MNANPPKKSPATVTGEPQALEHQIRLRAQELYEARGREDGHELDDWLRAEEEITSKKVRNRRLMIRAREAIKAPALRGLFSCKLDALPSFQSPI